MISGAGWYFLVVIDFVYGIQSTNGDQAMCGACAACTSLGVCSILDASTPPSTLDREPCDDVDVHVEVREQRTSVQGKRHDRHGEAKGESTATAKSAKYVDHHVKEAGRLGDLEEKWCRLSCWNCLPLANDRTRLHFFEEQPRQPCRGAVKQEEERAGNKSRLRRRAACLEDDDDDDGEW